MADEIQAQAGDDHQTTQAAESNDSPDTQTNGTNPMAQYEAELAAALSAQPTGDEHGGEPAESDGDGSEADAGEGDGEEQISDGADPQGDAHDEDGQDGDEPKVPNRIRLKTDEDKAVAAIAKAENISLLEAARRYDALKNPTKREEETDAGEGQPDANSEGNENDEVSEVASAIASLREERKAAWQELDTEKVEEIDSKIEELRDKLMDLKIADTHAKAQAAAKQAEEKALADAKHAEELADAEAKSLQFYPDLKNPESELNAEFWRVRESMEKKGDPILERSDAAWQIALLAAKKLGVPMADLEEITAPAKKSVQKRPVQPAGGNAGTTVPTQGPSRIDQAVDSIQSEYDYNQTVKSLLARG